ncbi:thioredoxin h, partial [Zopfochytrium polystomum]
MIHHVHSIDEFVSAVSTAKIVVVDFSAAWCPPCKASAPLFARLAEKYASIATFLSIDVDLHPEITAEAGVTVMPTFQFIMDGKRVAGTEVKGANIAAVEAMIVKVSFL